MPDILHRVGLKSSSPSDAYKALATIEGLSGWWTNDTQGESKVGGVIKFRFGTLSGFDMQVIELDPAKRVLWQVICWNQVVLYLPIAHIHPHQETLPLRAMVGFTALRQ